MREELGVGPLYQLLKEQLPEACAGAVCVLPMHLPSGAAGRGTAEL